MDKMNKYMVVLIIRSRYKPYIETGNSGIFISNDKDAYLKLDRRRVWTLERKGKSR